METDCVTHECGTLRTSMYVSALWYGVLREKYRGAPAERTALDPDSCYSAGDPSGSPPRCAVVRASSRRKDAEQDRIARPPAPRARGRRGVMFSFLAPWMVLTLVLDRAIAPL